MKKVDMFFEIQLHVESINGAMGKSHMAFREIWLPENSDKVKFDDVRVAHAWINKITLNEYREVHSIRRLEDDKYWEALYRQGETEMREMQLLAAAYTALRKALKQRPALLSKTECAKLERS